jgi:DNA-binding MarR family transcriptional regulator
MMARDCIAVRLRLVNRVITNIYDAALRPLDFTVSQMNILVVTAKLGVARPTEIGEILQIDTSTLSRTLERMRAKGWITTVADADDARSQPVQVTAAGKKLLQRIVPLWKEAQKKATDMLGSDGVATLDRVAASFGRLPRRSG